MESEQLKERQRLLLKFGDVVVLKGVEVNGGGFVSATTDMEPQARIEVLQEGVSSPPDIMSCRFEIVHKYQYVERRNFMLTLLSCGVTASDDDDSYEDDVFLRGTHEDMVEEELFQQLGKKERQEISAAKLIFDRETLVNSREMDRLIGKPVRYGQQVQLRHVSSGMFLTAKKTAASVDRGSLRLVLTYGHSASWFRISSGYRTKVDGDQIAYNEIASFMSSCYHGMAINHSTNLITRCNMLPVEASPSVIESREILCSPLLGRFKILPHSLHSSLISGFSTALTRSAAVRFMHHTSRAMLTVSRDGTLQFENLGTERLMDDEDDALNFDSQGLWRLQPEALEWAGQPGEYNTRYRLMHVLSGKYLAAPSSSEHAVQAQHVADSSALHLTADYSLPSCLWVVAAVVQGGEFTSELFAPKSYVLLQSSSGQWLSQASATKSGLFEMSSGKDPAPAVLSAQKRDDFVLEMSAIDESIQHKTEMVRSYAQVMSAFARHLRYAQKLTPSELKDLDNTATSSQIAALIDATNLAAVFGEWASRIFATLDRMLQMTHVKEGEGIRRADFKGIALLQRLCEESFLIHSVVDALDAINLRMLFGPEGKAFVSTNRIGAELVQFGTLCHRFIQSVCKDNIAIQNYVGKNFVEQLSKHLGGSVKAADTLASIYRNNMQQIQSVTETTLSHFIGLIRKEGKFPRFMNFLITQCGSMERPVPRNQNILVRELLMDSNTAALVKAETATSNKLDEVDCNITWFDNRTGVLCTWSCSSVTGNQDDSDKSSITEWERSETFIAKNPEVSMFIYFIFQLEFFSALCYGRNTNAQHALLEASNIESLGCDFSTLLSLIRSPRNPFVLRTACLKLVLHLYIDVNPYFELNIPKTTRQVRSRHDRLLEQGSLGSSFKHGKAQELKQALLLYLQDIVRNKPVACTGQCSLTLMAVGTIQRMFQLGILTISGNELDGQGAADVVEVLQQVLQAVQPQSSAGNWQIVMDIKATICSTLEYCLLLCADSQLERVFSAFSAARSKALSSKAETDNEETAIQSYSDEEDGSALIAPEDLARNHQDLDFDVPKSKIQELTSMLSCFTDAPKEQLYFLDSVWLDDLSKSDLAITLLELCRCRHAKLSECALGLLEKLLGRRRQLIRSMLDTIVVAHPDLGLMYQRCEVLLRLMTLEYSWVASMDENRRLAALQTCSACFQEIAGMLVPFTNIVIPINSDEVNEVAAADNHGPYGPLTDEYTRTRAVFLSKGRVRKFQDILHDIGATDIALRFLRLPLRYTVPEPDSDGAPQMPEATEPERRALFGVVYHFLSKMCVVDVKTGNSLNNAAIQEYLANDVQLYMSHMGIKFLNVTTTITAIFQNNPLLSRRFMHEWIVRRFVKQLVLFGEKKRTRWLSFLRSAAVVGSTPVPKNQAAILMLATEFEAKLLSMCKTNEEIAFREKAMADNCHLVNTESGTEARGSWLAYHRTTLLLLADCALGGDPTMVVKASGFLSLQEVIDGILLLAGDHISMTTVRYVTSGYWAVLQNVYFATDTESARLAVRAADNRIWSEKPKAGTETETHASASQDICVIAWVVREIEHAINQEPSTAIDSETQYFATSMLPKYIFPALTDYFKRHYWAHTSYLPGKHSTLLEKLVSATEGFAAHLRDLQERNAAKTINVARRSTRDFLSALRAASTMRPDSNEDLIPNSGAGMRSAWDDVQESQIEGSQATWCTTGEIEQSNWLDFISALAEGIGVHVSFETYEVHEIRAVEAGDQPVQFASLYIMARLLAQPYNRFAERLEAGTGKRQQLSWTYEEVPLHLAKLLSENHSTLKWNEETLVKMVRSMRLACRICDGRGDRSFMKRAWDCSALNLDFPAYMSEAQLFWVQNKYDDLGFTRCALSLMTHPKLSVQLEALELLQFLLLEGNARIQGTVASALSTDRTLSAAWFLNLEAVLNRCNQALKHEAQYLTSNSSASEEVDDEHYVEQQDDDDEPQQFDHRLNDSHKPVIFASKVIFALKWMCEGHHEVNQRLMKEQPGNGRDVDLLSESVQLIGSMHPLLIDSLSSGGGNQELPQLMIKTCQFLSEACLGPCCPNQNALAVDSPLLVYSNRTFGSILISESDSLAGIKLKAEVLLSLAQVLSSLLEGSGDEGVANRMRDILDFSAIEIQIREMLRHVNTDIRPNQFLNQQSSFSRGRSTSRKQIHPDPDSNLPSASSKQEGGAKAPDPGSSATEQDSTKEAVECAFLELLFFVQKLEFLTGSKNLLHAERESAKTSWPAGHEGTSDDIGLDEFLESSTASIELLWDGKLEKVFFPLTPICKQVKKIPMWEQEVMARLHSVKSEFRDNPLQKAIELMRLMEVTVVDLLLFEQLDKDLKWLKIFVDNQRAAVKSTFYLAILILVIMTFSIRESAAVWEEDKPGSYWACFALSWIEFFLMGIILLSFIAHDARRWHVVTQPRLGSRAVQWIESLFRSSTFSKDADIATANNLADPGQHTRRLTMSDMPSEHREDVSGQGRPRLNLQPPPKDKDKRKPTAVLRQVLILLLDITCYWRTWWFLALSGAAVLGLALSPFANAAFLLVFFVEFSAGQAILRALSEAFMPLLQTTLIGVAFILVSSVGSFVFFREDVETLQCSTMYQCVASHFVSGIYGDLSVLFHDDGDVQKLVPMALFEDPYEQFQIGHVMIFFVIWTFVLSNIFTGQVVDAFAAIRSEENNVQHDNATRCMVCSLERFEFDKNPGTSFEKHIACEHNPLSYVFYLHYLKATKVTEFKGHDSVIYNIINQESAVERSTWLPINRSKTLEQLVGHGTKSLEKAAEKQVDLLEYVKSTVQRDSATIHRLETRLTSLESRLDVAVDEPTRHSTSH